MLINKLNFFKFLTAFILILSLFSCITIKTKKNVSIDYFNIGNSYFESKDYKKAIESYEKALTYDPKSEDIIFNLILSYHLNKNFEKTEKLIISNFKKINSEFTKKLLMLLGNNYYLQAKFEQALKAYLEYEKIYLNDPNSSFNLGLTYLKLNDENKAFAYFIEAYKKDIKHIPSIYNIADYYYRKEDYQKSHEYFLIVLALDKKNSKIYYQLADIEYILNEYEHAKNNLLKAIEIETKNPDYYLLLAKVYAKGYKDKEKTIEYIEKAFIAGFKDINVIQQTPELKLLNNFEDFKRLLKKYNIK